MRLLHLSLGAVVVFLFLLTGQYMDYLDVRSGEHGDGVRMMFRSRHIYILLAGLVNLGIGSYFVARARGWRRRVQTAGSILVLAAPVLLLAAFFAEPGRPGLQRHFTLPGVVSLSIGTLCHALSGARREGSRAGRID
jgi:peptidoglycan/LPS O-acetylase OafA/YrhL